MPVTIGIDLSLTGLGVCAIPSRWDPSTRAGWASIRRQTFGTKPGDVLVVRADRMARDVCAWIARLYDHENDHAWLKDLADNGVKVCHEGYPLGGRVYNLDKLCEVGGIVKREIWQTLKTDVWASPQSTARKLVCGKLPQRDRKATTLAVLRKMAHGALDDAGDDECDAIVAANLYRKELGLSFVALTPVEPEKRPSKRRSRTQVTLLPLGRTA